MTATHIPVKDESFDISIEVKSRYKTIYILRARCERHELDKMHIFYLMGLMTLDATTRQLRSAFRKAFRQKHKCNDRIKFTTEIEDKYKWDTKLNQAVEIAS